ncbi:MAG: hypothetical protein WDO13_12095 [Verrucomicrobiota bacterium]
MLSNDNYVIGRFAYAVYDEGGLLDINAAGYSSTTGLTPDQIQALKGTLAGADPTMMTQMGIDSNALVAWRNASTGTTPASYLSYVTNAASTNGFLQIATGDRMFLNRQDLIKAAQNGTAGLTTNALPNLATFTRESTMPSWSPTTNAPSGGLYNYAGNARRFHGDAIFLQCPKPESFRRGGSFREPRNCHQLPFRRHLLYLYRAGQRCSSSTPVSPRSDQLAGTHRAQRGGWRNKGEYPGLLWINLGNRK